jgi:hypothetical protein
VGFSTLLLMVDMQALRTRVLPAVREWVIDGVVADWWSVALRANRIDALGRVEYPLAADLDAADSWMDIFDPMVGLRDVLDDDLLRCALEIAITSATVGDFVGFGKAYLAWDLLPDETDPVQALLPRPAPGDRVVELVKRLDEGLAHLRPSDGGYGEGIRGMLYVADTAALDDELTAHGSTAVVGTTDQIRNAVSSASSDITTRGRSTLVAVHAMAHRARVLRLGLLHGRDLHTSHLGSWDAGRFRRDWFPFRSE